MALTHIPYYDFTHRSAIYGEFILRQQSILEHERLIAGKYTQALEQRIANRLGYRYAITCSSGTAALYCIAHYLRHERGAKDAFVPACTFQSVYGAFKENAYTLTKLSVDENYLSISEAPRKTTDVSVVTGLLGQNTFTIPEGGYLIFDASQNWQGLHHRRNDPRYEEAYVAISFDPSKSLGGMMDGGIILTNDIDADKYFRHLTRIDSSNAYLKSGFYSLNFRMSEVGAAYLGLQLDLIDDWLAKRRILAQSFDSALPASCVIQRDYTTDEVQKYAIRVRDARHASEIALRWGVEARSLYPSEAIRPLLGLPMYPNLATEETSWRYKQIAIDLERKGLL